MTTPSQALDRDDTIQILAKQAIGVFDSGSGGMVTAAWLLKMLKDGGLDGIFVVFFTANVDGRSHPRRRRAVKPEWRERLAAHFSEVSHDLIKRKATAVILGCTILNSSSSNLPNCCRLWPRGTRSSAPQGHSRWLY